MLLKTGGRRHTNPPDCEMEEKMSFNWINPNEISFQCILLMDRYMIRQICGQDCADDEAYFKSLSIALAYNDAVAWYCRTKAPETAGVVEKLVAAAPGGCTGQQVRQAECFVLDRHDWAVVYIYPELMNRNCPYIYNWDREKLFELADFTDKVVLDVGAGTGRLSFAAALYARHVYASEPVERLREFMRDKILREKIRNVTVLDGMCHWLPYEDNTFDIVMSGHVVGDDYDGELAELERVVKSGGWILDCPGEEDRKSAPKRELLDRGFESFYYKGKTGGDIYRYRKQVLK